MSPTATSTVVITGSTKGIGRGLAEAFAALGHKVVISGRQQDEVDALAKTISDSHPGQCSGLACDVSDQSQVQALWDFAIDQYQRVDLWINNAGFARTVWPIVDIPTEDLHTMVHSNMLGTMYGSQVAARGFLAQEADASGCRGKLFNMLGGGSDGEIFPGMGGYGATKRGLDYFTNALCKELKDSGVYIGKVRPGMIITEGVVREAKADPENFAKSRKTMNLLVDTADTVAPYLAEQMLAVTKSGVKIRWLTGGKIAMRMLIGRIKGRADQFEAFGL